MIDIRSAKESLKKAQDEKNKASAQLEVRKAELERLRIKLKEDFGIEDHNKIDDELQKLNAERKTLETKIGDSIKKINELLGTTQTKEEY